MVETELYTKVEFQESLLEAISKSIFDFIAVVRADNRKIIFVNEMGARMFGYEKAEDLLGQLAPRLRKKEPDETTLVTIDKEVRSKGFFCDEIEYVTAQGVSFWGRMQETLFSVCGKEYRLWQIEKTDRAKSAEESLMKEKQRFGALMDYASIGVVIINQDLEVVLMNQFTLRLFGYQKEELTGKDVMMLVPLPFHEKYREHLQDYFKQSSQLQTTTLKLLYARKKDKSEFPAEVSIGNFKTDKERFAILFISDITERKKDEDEIKKLNTELEIKVKERTDELDRTIRQLKNQIKETEKAKAELERVTQFQKVVLDSSGALIIATDAHGTINLFNKAAEELLGYKAEEVVGKHDPSFFHDKEETRKRAIQYSEELDSDVQPGFEVYVAKSKNNQPNKNEWIYVKKDGTTFPVSLSVTAFRNKQNKITGFLGVAVDISDTKKTEEKLMKALEREKDLNEMKSKFVSIASHEFRTPLSTILSSSYLLQKYLLTNDQPQREKHIERIVSSVNQLTDILNDLLSVGKIEEGKIQPVFSKFDISDHIKSSINEVKAIQKRGQQIIFNHTGKEQVFLDPSMLMHIMLNLLSNAIKFSPEDSSIIINTETTDSLLRLKIKDHGIGIPENEQQHLFERFFRSANAANIEGTGLGLHIVQKYTELLNGKIECFSKPEKGTEFFIEIKMAQQKI